MHITSARISPSNTVERHAAPLDARSAVALAFIDFWTERHATIKPAAGTTIRRALQLLAGHLSSLDGEDISSEVRAFRSAGKGEGSALSLTQARARIENHLRAPAAQPMLHWRDALEDQHERRESLAMLERLEELMGEAA